MFNLSQLLLHVKMCCPLIHTVTAIYSYSCVDSCVDGRGVRCSVYRRIQGWTCQQNCFKLHLPLFVVERGSLLNLLARGGGLVFHDPACHAEHGIFEISPAKHQVHTAPAVVHERRSTMGFKVKWALFLCERGGTTRAPVCPTWPSERPTTMSLSPIHTSSLDRSIPNDVYVLIPTDTGYRVRGPTIIGLTPQVQTTSVRPLREAARLPNPARYHSLCDTARSLPFFKRELYIL